MVIFWDSSWESIPRPMSVLGNETCGTGTGFTLQCTSFESKSIFLKIEKRDSSLFSVALALARI
jgi:hypothetical protein